MRPLELGDPAALEAALDALPLETWVEVETAGETFLLVRVPGGFHLPGDVTIAPGDIVQGEPSWVEVLEEGDPIAGHLPPEQAIAEARGAFARAQVARDCDEAERLTRDLDDLDSVGWSEAGALRDEVQAWLDDEEGKRA